MSERLAGSTILALGSSISLIASNMNAVLLNKVEEIELGLTGILGAAIFEMTVGLAIGCFLIKKNYKLSFPILARDLIIYLIVLVILYYYLEMKYITFYKSLFLVFLWILYMVYLIFTAQDEQDDMMIVIIEDQNQENEKFISSCDDSEIINNREEISLPQNNLQNISNNQIHNSNNFSSNDASNLLNEESKLLDHKNYLSHREIKRIKFLDHIEKDISIFTFLIKGMLKIFSKPWEILLSLITPKSSEGMYLFIHFLIPFILIWNVSEIELFVLEKLLRRLNVSANFLGLTISAWGNNAPDMFNVASAMSKGMVDLAMNAAIASEIHNILLGLALPWLVYNIKMKKSLNFSSNNLYAFTLFFFSFFILSFIIGLKLNKFKLNWKFAIYLIILYFLFLIMIFLISFQFK